MVNGLPATVCSTLSMWGNAANASPIASVSPWIYSAFSWIAARSSSSLFPTPLKTIRSAGNPAARA